MDLLFGLVIAKSSDQSYQKKQQWAEAVDGPAEAVDGSAEFHLIGWSSSSIYWSHLITSV